MTPAALVHVVVSGRATGSIYALMALSLVIIYNATRTLNFAQGEMLMISTFVAWSVMDPRIRAAYLGLDRARPGGEPGYDRTRRPDAVTDQPKPDRQPDPQAEAERRLRMAMAAEARRERDLRSNIQKGFYGCVTVFVVLFLIALFLF